MLRTRLPLAAGLALTCSSLFAGVGGGEPTDVHGASTVSGLLRFPDISAREVVFVFANDLWVVPREGGLARPLASPPGADSRPRFSPDGSLIAFAGNYEGDTDIYVIPAEGGVPRRRTFHPANEILWDWTPDGRILYGSNAESPLGRMQQLWVTGADSGVPERLPLPYGGNPALHADGRRLVYTPHFRDTRTWKRYMGGMASDLWQVDLEAGSSLRLTEWAGTDSQPMWQGDTLWFLSDAGPAHRLNLWRIRPGGRREQVTFHEEFDVKWPSIGPGPDGRGEIVFQLGAEIRILDLRTLEERTLEVRIPGDRREPMPVVKDVSPWIQSAFPGPTGKRVVVSARGDLWSLPARNGPPRNLSLSSGSAERFPAWSPDGRWIAFFSDREGENDLYLQPAAGGEARRLTDLGPGYRRHTDWSPDSRYILFTDNFGGLWRTEAESGETRLLDRDPRSWDNDNAGHHAWSHDGRWLVYARSEEDKPTCSLWILDMESLEKRRLTSSFHDERSPAFDRKGDWLFFASHRRFQPTYSSIATDFVYKDTGVLLAVPLRAEVELPWRPEVDEEEVREPEAKEDGAPEEEAGPGAEKQVAESGHPLSGTWSGEIRGPEEFLPGGALPLTAVLETAPDGTVTGRLEVPIGGGTVQGSWDAESGRLEGTVTTDLGDLLPVEATLEDGVLKGTVSLPGATLEFDLTRTPGGGESQEEESSAGQAEETVEIDFQGFEERALPLPAGTGVFSSLAVNDKNQLLFVRRSDEGASILLLDLKDDSRSAKTVAAGASAFRLTADGKKLLRRGGDGLILQDAAAGGKAQSVATTGMRQRIEPRQEWRQMFLDAWRNMRDFFYDPNMHGVDWVGLRDRYLALVKVCGNREDLNYVLGELIAEVNVGHAYRGGGDLESAPGVGVGLLGADLRLDGEGVWRFAAIHEGAPWDSEARNPLRAPDVDVKPGESLLAVNGTPLAPDREPWGALEGTAGRPTVLRIGPAAGAEGEPREVVVTPLASDALLRYRAWVEANRRRVEEATAGRVGYIHVPDTQVRGQNELYRQFFGQIDKEALILDDRWNGGGQIPTRFIELLNRPVTNYWARRSGKDWKWPPDSHQGPKCMLINGEAGSGGDAFPHYFRQAGLGKLVGTRTWGGLVGLSGSPPLIDNGAVMVPTFAFYETDGTWGIEGHGVEPDLPVVDDPGPMMRGEDPQLEAAIRHMLEELERNAYRPPQRPAWPDRSGMGIPREDW